MNGQLRTQWRSDARDNRERILAATRAVLSDGGAKVTIEQIARRAEVGVATVYRHFGNKQALVAAALSGPGGGHGMLCSTIIEQGLASADPWDGFSRALNQLMHLHADDRGRVRARLSTALPTPDRAAERARSASLMQTLLGRAKDAGALRRDVAIEDVALALMASEGIRASSTTATHRAAQRLSALLLASFQGTRQDAGEVGRREASVVGSRRQR